MNTLSFRCFKYRIRIIPVATIGKIDTFLPMTKRPCKSLDFLRVQWYKSSPYHFNLQIKLLFFFYLNIFITDKVKEDKNNEKWEQLPKRIYQIFKEQNPNNPLLNHC